MVNSEGRFDADCARWPRHVGRSQEYDYNAETRKNEGIWRRWFTGQKRYDIQIDNMSDRQHRHVHSPSL